MIWVMNCKWSSQAHIKKEYFVYVHVYEGRSKTHIIKSCRRRFFFNLECLKPASRKSRARPAQGPRKAS